MDDRPTMDAPAIAVWPPDERPWLLEAVRRGGGVLVDPDAADGLVWADPAGAERLSAVLRANERIRWVQLPWAGIEPFVDVLDTDRTWTCGKGVYAEPVAEHALALLLAGFRGVVHYSRQRRWGTPRGTNLAGANVTVLGGGGIAQALLALLAPFDCSTTVVRRTGEPIEGAGEVLPSHRLHEALADADAVVLALSLTPETERVIGASELALLPAHAWLVNVARGRHVDTDALVAALAAGDLGGAGLDVTDPEPLPDDHPLWGFDNVVISPHTANTPEMAVPLLSERVARNVARFARGHDLLGLVDVAAGY